MHQIPRRRGQQYGTSAVFVVVGQAAIPIPVLGGLAEEMIGYTISTASYGVLMESLNDDKLTREEKIEIKKSVKSRYKRSTNIKSKSKR